MITQTDEKMLIRFEVVRIFRPQSNDLFKIINTDTKVLGSITFPCGLSDIRYTQNYRATINRTFGGGWVNDFGNDFLDIALNTTIQTRLTYRLKSLTASMSNPFDIGGIFDFAFGDNKKSGLDAFLELKYLILNVKNYYSFSEAKKALVLKQNNKNPLDINPLTAAKGVLGNALNPEDTIWNLTSGFGDFYFRFYDYYNDEYWYVNVDQFDITQSKANPFGISLNLKMTGLWEYTAKRDFLSKKFSIYPSFLDDITSFIGNLQTFADGLATMVDRFARTVQRFGTTAKIIAAAPRKLLQTAGRVLNSVDKMVQSVFDVIEFPLTLIEELGKGLDELALQGRILASNAAVRSHALVTANHAEKMKRDLTLWSEGQREAITKRYPIPKMTDNSTNPDTPPPTRPGLSKPDSVELREFAKASINLLSNNAKHIINIKASTNGTLGNNIGFIISGSLRSGIKVQKLKFNSNTSDTYEIIESKTFSNNYAELTYHGNGIAQFTFSGSTIFANVVNSTDLSTNQSWNFDLETSTLQTLDDLINSIPTIGNIRYNGNALNAKMGIDSNSITVTLSGNQSDGSENLRVLFSETTRMKDLPDKINKKKMFRIKYVGNATSSFLTIKDKKLKIILSGDQSDGSNDITVNLTSKTSKNVYDTLTSTPGISIEYTGNASSADVYIKAHEIRTVLSGDQTDGTLGFSLFFIDFSDLQELVSTINTIDGYTATVINNASSDSLNRKSGISCKTPVTLNRTTYIEVQLLWDTKAILIHDVDQLEISSLITKILYADTKYEFKILDETSFNYTTLIKPISNIEISDLDQPYSIQSLSFFKFTKKSGTSSYRVKNFDSFYTENLDFSFLFTKNNKEITDWINTLPDIKAELASTDVLKLDEDYIYRLQGGK